MANPSTSFYNKRPTFTSAAMLPTWPERSTKSSVRSSPLNEEWTRRRLSKSSRACAAVAFTRKMSGHRRPSLPLLQRILKRSPIRISAYDGQHELETTMTKLQLSVIAQKDTRSDGRENAECALRDVKLMNQNTPRRKRDPPERQKRKPCPPRKCDLGHVVSPARMHSAGVGSIPR